MLASIITAAFNSEATIGRTIEAVLGQTCHDIEYIIVDGRSTDRTVEIAEGYTAQFADKGMGYRIISEPDNGIYDAMNKGIQLAKGELVGIINSDDWYEPGAVECAVRNFEKYHYDLFYADLRIISGRKSFIKKAKDSRIISSRFWNHPTTFIPKRVYDRYQYKTDNIHDDWDLILRLRKDGAKVCVVNEVLANFTRNGVSHGKGIGKALERAGMKYRIYRENGYSRWYVIECFGMEAAKLML